MNIFPTTGEAPLEGILRYIESEYSFTFEVASPADLEARSGGSGVTSLSIGTLQVEVAVETKAILFVWGLHPRTNWKLNSVGTPHLELGSARLEASVPLHRGVTIPIAPLGSWTTLFDAGTGWVRVSKEPESISDHEVMVATGVSLGLTRGELTSVWLHPVFE